jgi:hypothetical protein
MAAPRTPKLMASHWKTLNGSLRKNKLRSPTQSGAILTKNVAWATEVNLIEKNQRTKSIVRAKLATIMGKEKFSLHHFKNSFPHKGVDTTVAKKTL